MLSRLNIELLPLSESRAAPDIDPAAFAFLNHLRFVAMDCRVKPRTDLFEACALLKVDKAASRNAHAEALMRCLAEALGKPARLYAPGVEEFTFDEQWLIRLGKACTSGDEDSLRFLLSSRVAFENRRFVRFLVGRIAECFYLN
ncbi:MAG: hypothetical protein OXC60_16955 [Litoreibacter sp.]|nr:hypothetical protein [Litoreibacter sp.]